MLLSGELVLPEEAELLVRPVNDLAEGAKLLMQNHFRTLLIGNMVEAADGEVQQNLLTGRTQP